MSVRFETVFELVARTGRKTGARRSRSRSGPRLEELIRAREAAGDRIAFGTGLVLAVSSMAFLIYALETSAGRPSVPMMLPSVADGIPVNRSLAARARQDSDFDPMTTGSIPKEADAGGQNRRTEIAARVGWAGAKIPSRSYVVWRVFRGVALVEGPDGLREVSPGAMLPGAGQVLSIEQSPKGWMVVTSEAIIGPASL
jgi:hypothetical protein